MIERLEPRLFLAASVPAPRGISIVTETTSLTLTWKKPTLAQQSRMKKYNVTFAAGEFAEGPAGTFQTLALGPKRRSVTLENLKPFTLYTIGISAVDVHNRKAPTRRIAWTDATSTQQRFLYALDLPKNVQGFETLKPQIEVFDINYGHKWVKNIPLPSGLYGGRGIAACAATQKLYFDFFDTPANSYQTGGLACVDLRTDKVLWIKRYPKSVVPSPDRFDITPDGKKIYMPVGEHGPDNFWEVLNAETGDSIGRIEFVTAPHNTIVSVDGTRAFLEGQEKGEHPDEFDHRVGVVDTATNKLIQTVGPFNDVVRPFTINGSATLVYGTINNMVGFQVGDVVTGKILYTVTPPNYTQPPPVPQRSLSHGIAMTPDETKLFVVDGVKVGIHVWDISRIATEAPTYLGFIKTRGTGKNLAGQNDPAASNDAPGVPAWVISSWDGKYVYAESGEIIDTATLKVIGQLRAGSAPYTHSRFMVEIEFDAGNVTHVTNQFGIGRVR